MIVSIVNIPIFAFEKKVVNDDILLLGTKSKIKKTDVSYNSVDKENNRYGVEDFTISNDNTFILNTANNSVFVYKNNILNDVVDMNKLNIKALLISSDDNKVYTLNNNKTICKIDINNKSIKQKYVFDIPNEAISDFTVKNNLAYISLADGEYGTTYILNLDKTINDCKSVSRFEGKYFSDDVTYKCKLICDKNKSIGNACELIIIDKTNKKSTQLNILSKNLIAGAQYLGTDTKNNYVVKLYEIAFNKDYTISVEETIRTISPNDELIGIKLVNDNSLSLSNRTKVINGEYTI